MMLKSIVRMDADQVTRLNADRQAELQQALQRNVLYDLRVVATGVAVCFLAFLVFNVLDLPAHAKLPLVVHDAALVLIFSLLRIAAGAGWVPGRWANFWVAMVAWLASSNILLAAALLKTPFYTMHLGVVMIGAGSFLLSKRWLLTTIASMVLAWAAVMASFLSAKPLVHHFFILVPCGMVAFAMHALRYRSFLRLHGLREFTIALMATRTTEEVAVCLAKHVAGLLNVPHVAACLADRESACQLRQGEFSRLPEEVDDVIVGIDASTRDKLASGAIDVWHVQQDKAQVLELLRRHTSARRVMALPLHFAHILAGVVFVAKTGRSRFTTTDRDLGATCVSQARVALESVALLKEVQRLATTDELTGLYNRRQFFFLGQRELLRVARHGGALSALMIDVDHFKSINDTRGHAVGDIVLREVGAQLKGSVRRTDVVARYGGEEFVLLLPETSPDHARHLAERLRETIANAIISADGVPLTISVSIGVASYVATPSKQTSGELDTLLAQADQALYRAKQGGRNRVEAGV